MTFTDLLDPRANPEPRIAASVNIPANELENRVYELPPPGSTIRVADTGSEANLAIAKLERLNRTAIKEQSFKEGPSAGYRLWRPNPLIDCYVNEIKPGRALDIGCGSGRDAVELAGLGWSVTAIDHLPDALNMGRALASRYHLTIDFNQLNVGSDHIPEGPFDLVTMFMFLNRQALQQAVKQLNVNGCLMLECYSKVNAINFNKPASKNLYLATNEVLDLFPEFEMIHHSEDWRTPSKHTVRFVGRKVAHSRLP